MSIISTTYLLELEPRKSYNTFMKNLLTWLSKRRFPYEPLIKVEISKSAIIHNYLEFTRAFPTTRIAPVLKSNAYGHGLFEIAHILKEAEKNKTIGEIPFIVVDSYFEAVALRSDDIKEKILVIGYTSPETMKNCRIKNISFTIGNIDTLKDISKTISHKISIHIKIDTGMRRQGILPDEIIQATKLLQENKNIVLEGLCTHLSDADNADQTFTNQQIILWNQIVDKIKTQFPSIKYFHASNTDGHNYSDIIQANISRLGIGLYGLVDGNKFSPKLNLKPALEIKTIITGLKKLRAGESVGYSNTFVAKNDMTIATIPVGYYEGLDRRLSNAGFVEIGPLRVMCPIIGRVSMNITCIDVSDCKNISIGDEVIVFSNNPQSKNSIFNIAKICNTITYEISTKIAQHLKRVVG